jgi:hypothetical protein
VPQLLRYPTTPILDKQSPLAGLFCYIIAPYSPGVAIVIRREKGNVGIRLGDWYGQELSEARRAEETAKLVKPLSVLTGILQTIGLAQAQFFFAQDGRLVDMQTSLNKMVGPGMLRDLFSNTLPVQQVLEINHLTPEKIDALYATDLTNGAVIKPARPRCTDGGVLMYARVIR